MTHYCSDNSWSCANDLRNPLLSFLGLGIDQRRMLLEKHLSIFWLICDLSSFSSCHTGHIPQTQTAWLLMEQSCTRPWILTSSSLRSPLHPTIHPSTLALLWSKHKGDSLTYTSGLGLNQKCDPNFISEFWFWREFKFHCSLKWKRGFSNELGGGGTTIHLTSPEIKAAPLSCLALLPLSLLVSWSDNHGIVVKWWVAIRAPKQFPYFCIFPVFLILKTPFHMRLLIFH